MLTVPRSLLRLGAGLVAGLASTCALVGAENAHAGLLVASGADCDTQTIERPFLPWADPAPYTLVPGGSFATGAASWTLSGARVVAENEPFRVRDDHRAASVRIDAGGSATSPAMCVGILHPTLRLFARNTGPATDSLTVEALYEDAAGQVRSVVIGQLTGHRAWAPTLPLPLVVNLLAVLPQERTPVAFRFSSPSSSTAWLIDDVYVDPYSKG